MGIISKDSGGSGDFEPIEEGTYVARCVSVVDIGMQQTAFGSKQKVYLGFEVPEIRVEWKDKEGKEHAGPAFIGSRYTNSINDKAWLGQHLKSWRGRAFTDEERDGFDLMNVLGAPCMISVTHTKKGDKVYANIGGIMRLPKGTECPPAESELLAYTPFDNNLIGNFDKLPEWLQKVCTEGHGKAANYSGPVHGSNTQPHSAPNSEDFDDDIPF